MRLSPNDGEFCNSSRAPQLTQGLKCQARHLAVCGKRHNYLQGVEKDKKHGFVFTNMSVSYPEVCAC